MYNNNIYKKKGDIYLWKKKKFLACGSIKKEEAIKLGERVSSNLEIVMHISVMTYQEALNYLLKYYHLSEKEICDLPNDDYSLPARQLERYKNGETVNFSKKVVIAICIAFKVPFNISEVLLRLAGIALTLSDEDMFYKTILCEYYMKSLTEVNEMLIANDFDALTSKK